MKIMGTVAWILVFGCLLASSSEMEVPCRVTTDGSKTTYSIDHTLADCYEYSFANSTNYVLANQAEPSYEPVIRSNMSTLVTSRCIENIISQISCVSQGVIHTVTSNCSTACSEMLKGGINETGSPSDTSSTWNRLDVVVPVLLVLLVLLVLVVLVVLVVLALPFYKRRRKLSCPQQYKFAGVETGDAEAGNH